MRELFGSRVMTRRCWKTSMNISTVHSPKRKDLEVFDVGLIHLLEPPTGK